MPTRTSGGRLRKWVPLFPDGSVDWSDFTEKACKGSEKAADLVTRASIAVAVRVAGKSIFEEASEAEFEAAIRSVFPVRPPFADAQEFLDALFEWGCLDAPMAVRQEPLFARAHYDALWRRQVRVDAFSLVHDAVLYCCSYWGADELFRLCSAVESTSDFNSQDVVAAALFLLVTQEP